MSLHVGFDRPVQISSLSNMQQKRDARLDTQVGWVGWGGVGWGGMQM